MQEHGIKILVHGPSGSGKTRLCGTTGEDEYTIIISAERGLMSLRDHDIDAIEVTSIQQFREARDYVQRAEKYRWVILDSVSEVAEVILEEEMEQNRDGRAAYGEMADRVLSIIRDFRNLSCNVVMTAKQGREDDQGTKLFVPQLPGRKLTQNVSYMFDEVFAIRVERNSDGTVESRVQTQRDRQYECKDRSGALEFFEEPNLEAIYDKIVEEAGIEEAKPASAPAPSRDE
ncbi:MAG: ATP-binding protein, partial [Bradymonadaceae bacterium]